jgi:hypothetical protein
MFSFVADKVQYSMQGREGGGGEVADIRNIW